MILSVNLNKKTQIESKKTQIESKNIIKKCSINYFIYENILTLETLFEKFASSTLKTGTGIAIPICRAGTFCFSNKLKLNLLLTCKIK